MKKLSILAAAVAASMAHAVVIIDDFTTGAYTTQLTSGSEFRFQNGSMVGGDRATLVTVEANPFSQRLDFSIGAGLAVTSSGTGLDAKVNLDYGFKDDGSGGAERDDMGLTLLAEDRFKVKFLSNDRDLLMRIDVVSDDGTKVSTASKVVAGGQFDPFEEEVSFASFAGDADFGNIGQIRFTFDSGRSGDYALAGVEAVPEPASMAALAMGLAGIAARRRRK